MVGLSGLWMPIVLSAVFVFVASSIIHMMLGWHKNDMTAPPNQDAVMDALRGFNIQPGEYHFPHPADMQDMKSPEFIAKTKKGPIGIMSILPSGGINMGKLLGQWFVYSLVIAVIAAYVTGRTHGQGTPYLEVFRVSGAVTFCCYGVAHWQNWIWWGKGTRFTLTNTLDALIYALLTAGTFGWLWPK